jgi:hypothetical protein
MRLRAFTTVEDGANAFDELFADMDREQPTIC